MTVRAGSRRSVSGACVLDTSSGKLLQEWRSRTTRAALARRLAGQTAMRVALEVGTHSPWASRLLASWGREVLIANPGECGIARGDTPATHWRPSPRPFPARVAEPKYAGHLETRLVSDAGCFRFKKQVIFISQALAQEWIGLEEVDVGIWSVYFYDVLLARLDEREMTLNT